MKLCLLLCSFFLAGSVYAFPEAPHNALEVTNPIDFNDENQSNYDFEGIIKLSNCSGSLISFSGQPMTAKALVLTNGHCYSSSVFGGMIKPGEVIVNLPTKRSMKIFDKEMKLFSVNASKLVYAAMTDTDIAIYELSLTYQQIINKYHISPFELDVIHPSLGVDIDIVSGYWDRGYSCGIDAFIFKLKEGDWTFKDSIRYTDGCDTIGGTSGSPIILKGSRSVIGINNTANEDGKKCAINNPCEVSEDGKILVLKDKKYGQQTYQIYSCLSLDFKIDLNQPGCLLAKPIKK